MSSAKKLMGTTAVGGALAIEDVFSTYLYTGNGTANTITNGIDLAGEGGMVWFKNRQYSYDHLIWDTERGSAGLFTNSTAAQNTGYSSFFTSYNSDGISFTGSFIGNASGSPHVAWTWRKAPRFFDCVTWTGDNVQGRAISHNLGDVPGCIVVKITSGTSDNWVVYHRSVGAGKFLKLNATDSQLSSVAVFPTNPTDSVFYVGNDSAVNWSGGTYVAYLFAHDPLGPSGDGSDGLIACGSFTSASSQQAQFVELGWEPQWLLVKTSTLAGSWRLVDCMRGIVTGGTGPLLYPDTNYSEATITNQNWFEVNPTGFTLTTSGWSSITGANNTAIYIAIRRGPMRQPTSGTEVFAVDSYDATVPYYDTTFPVDFAINKSTSGSNSRAYDRLRGGAVRLHMDATSAESAATEAFDYMNGWNGVASASYYSWMFRRAPGFFDVVAYTGNGVAGRTVPHNLGVAPEMMIVKRRNGTSNWAVYHGATGATDVLFLNTTAATASNSFYWNNTDPTADNFVLNTGLNTSTYTYIAYLFATLPGVSKVGSYTGNGSSQTINCGFTSGARFVLIKRTDSTGDWYVWDTARGIVAANDPHLSLNTTAAEVTTDDSVDPDNSGFIVNQDAATNINVSSASYIYYAIA